MAKKKDPTTEVGKKRKKGKKESLLTGIIIGGAIGSVLGMTLSPKSGKENREFVKQKTRETWDKSRVLLGEVIQKKEKKKGFWHKLNRLFVRKKDDKD